MPSRFAPLPEPTTASLRSTAHRPFLLRYVVELAPRRSQFVRADLNDRAGALDALAVDIAHASESLGWRPLPADELLALHVRDYDLQTGDVGELLLAHVDADDLLNCGDSVEAAERSLAKIGVQATAG